MKNDYGYDLNDDFIYIRIKKYNLSQEEWMKVKDTLSPKMYNRFLSIYWGKKKTWFEKH